MCEGAVDAWRKVDGVATVELDMVEGGEATVELDMVESGEATVELDMVEDVLVSFFFFFFLFFDLPLDVFF